MLNYRDVTFGSDPELFVADDNGNIIGSERVVPKEGLGDGVSKVVRDGIQAEFNIMPSTCREVAAVRVKRCFIRLNNQLIYNYANLHICFDGVVDVSPVTLASVQPSALQFGCKPSLNAYREDAGIGVNGATYLKRAAGGHIHVGSLPHSVYYNPTLHGMYGLDPMPEEADYRKRLAPIFDVLVGNTCVMLDQGSDQAERRKYYGRAGEYRLPAHGFEYRTISNFWFRNYILFSLVLGLSRMAVNILADTLEGKEDLERALLSKVNFRRIVKAIDTNDRKLAAMNFKYVENFIKLHVQEDQERIERLGGGYRHEVWPICQEKLPMFKRFLTDVQKNGLESVFPDDPVVHWTNLKPTEESYRGFEVWLRNRYGN